MIRATDQNVTRATNKTIIIQGHSPIGSGAGLTEYRDMLIGIRNNFAALKKWGVSLSKTIAAKPFAIGIGLFLFGVSSDWLCRNLIGDRFRVLDAFVLGVVAGVAGLVALSCERLRTRELLKRLIIVREMNHHVRNALQVVTFAASTQQGEHVATMVRDAVARIDWALKEVLTGNGADRTKREATRLRETEKEEHFRSTFSPKGFD